jgi:hypothetical protein
MWLIPIWTTTGSDHLVHYPGTVSSAKRGVNVCCDVNAGSPANNGVRNLQACAEHITDINVNVSADVNAGSPADNGVRDL